MRSTAAREDIPFGAPGYDPVPPKREKKKYRNNNNQSFYCHTYFSPPFIGSDFAFATASEASLEESRLTLSLAIPIILIIE